MENWFDRLPDRVQVVFALIFIISLVVVDGLFVR